MSNFFISDRKIKVSIKLLNVVNKKQEYHNILSLFDFINFTGM